MFLFPSEKIGSEKSVSPGACLTEGVGGWSKAILAMLVRTDHVSKRDFPQLFLYFKAREDMYHKKCCIYSHFTVLDSAGSKIYRGLVESVGMKKSAGEDDQYSYIWYIWYNIYDLIYIRWSFKHKKETLEGFHREPWKTAGWCQLCKRSPLLSEFCKKAQI